MRILDATSIPIGELVDRVAEEVFAGRLLVFPTDTVYGLGCDPAQLRAVSRLYALKVRDAGKPLSLHFASAREALEYTGDNALAARAIESFLPGPLTVVVARPAHVSAAVTAGLPTLGLRVPDYALCSAILERCGPLAATSANYGGHPAFTGEERRGDLPPADLMVDAGPTPLRGASTVLDCTGGVPRLIREGVLTVETLEATLGRIVRPSGQGRA